MKINFLSNKSNKKTHPLFSNKGSMKASEKNKVWNEITRQAVQDQQDIIRQAKGIKKQRQ